MQAHSLKKSANDSPVYREVGNSHIHSLTPRREDPHPRMLPELSQRKGSSKAILIVGHLAAVRDDGTAVMMEFSTAGTVQKRTGATLRQATRDRVRGSGLKSR